YHIRSVRGVFDRNSRSGLLHCGGRMPQARLAALETRSAGDRHVTTMALDDVGHYTAEEKAKIAASSYESKGRSRPDSERFRSGPRTCGRFRCILSCTAASGEGSPCSS